MDALAILRDFVINKQTDQIIVTDEYVEFPGRGTFLKSTPTAFKSKKGQGDFYNVYTVVFFAQNLHLPVGEYFSKARTVGQVGYTDRDELTKYLTGVINTSEYIQLVIPETVDELPAKRARLDSQQQPGAAAELGAPTGAEIAEDTELRTIRNILANERQLRDRNSMLSVPKQNFVPSVGNVLSNVLAQQKRERPQRPEQRTAQQPQRRAPIPENRPSGRYQRETAPDAALRNIGAQDLGLQTVGFAEAPIPGGAKPAAPLNGGAPNNKLVPPPPPPSGPQQQPKPPTQAKPPPPSSTRPPSSSQQRQSRSKPPSSSSSRDGKERFNGPIILVPPGKVGLINMLNVKPFLEDGRFVTWQKCEEDGVEKKSGIFITRKIGVTSKEEVRFLVTDQEPPENDQSQSAKAFWSRVVAVFALGKTWQFKRFPFKGAKNGDMVETFNNIAGAFVHFKDEKVDPVVKGWNVQLLTLQRHTRHQDLMVVQSFYKHLDEVLRSKGCSLLYR